MNHDVPSLDSMTESRRAIEAMVLVASEPTPVHLLSQVLELAPEVVEVLCRDLAEEYERQGRGFQLVEVAGGWSFQTHPDLYPYVERYAMEGIPNRLSSAALETLAIVAYKQPISRSQISAIRGVNVDGVLRTLEQRGYVEETGRDPGPGQAALFGTTPFFLERLGLASVADLPPLGDFVPAAHVVEALEQTLRFGPDPDPEVELETEAELETETEPENTPEVEPDVAVEAEAVNGEVNGEVAEAVDLDDSIPTDIEQVQADGLDGPDGEVVIDLTEDVDIDLVESESIDETADDTLNGELDEEAEAVLAESVTFGTMAPATNAGPPTARPIPSDDVDPAPPPRPEADPDLEPDPDLKPDPDLEPELVVEPEPEVVVESAPGPKPELVVEESTVGEVSGAFTGADAGDGGRFHQTAGPSHPGEEPAPEARAPGPAPNPQPNPDPGLTDTPFGHDR